MFFVMFLCSMYVFHNLHHIKLLYFGKIVWICSCLCSLQLSCNVCSVLYHHFLFLQHLPRWSSCDECWMLRESWQWSDLWTDVVSEGTGFNFSVISFAMSCCGTIHCELCLVFIVVWMMWDCWYMTSDIAYYLLLIINMSINKANILLGIIRRSFCALDNNSFTLLYKTIVRPHLEYAATIWNPYKKGYIDDLEKVQRRAT